MFASWSHCTVTSFRHEQTLSVPLSIPNERLQPVICFYKVSDLSACDLGSKPGGGVILALFKILHTQKHTSNFSGFFRRVASKPTWLFSSTLKLGVISFLESSFPLQEDTRRKDRSRVRVVSMLPREPHRSDWTHKHNFAVFQVCQPHPPSSFQIRESTFPHAHDENQLFSGK